MTTECHRLIKCGVCDGLFYAAYENDVLQLCSGCTYREFYTSTTLYRALRDTEDTRAGLRRRREAREVTLEEHVLNGSNMATQYISTTTNLDVAVYFAVRGYQRSRSKHVRVAEIEVHKPKETQLCMYIQTNIQIW